jgi:acetyl-CoA carboxylase biotin carboxyl carrier protein
MTFKEIQDLLKFIGKSELSEVRIKDGEFEITVRNKNYSKGSGTGSHIASHPVSIAPPVMHSAESSSEQALSSTPVTDIPPVEEKNANANLVEIKSPIVGTFYRSASPDKPAYVSVGDSVSQGDVVCIVEAMKLFNEIESEVSGKIVKVMVEDASPVEYDQVLFLVDPKG